MKRSSAVATILAVVALGAVPGAALAHGEGWLAAADVRGDLHTSIEAPTVRGLRIQVLDGRVPALFVHNATGSRLVVRDADGSPFLEIGPRGVRADVGSRAYLLSAGAPLRPNGHPRWRRLSRQPQWAWLEYRARVHGGGAAPDFGARPRTVHRWASPMTLGQREIRVEGEVRWLPTGTHHTTRRQARDRSTSGSGWWLVAVALGLPVIAASLIASENVAWATTRPRSA